MYVDAPPITFHDLYTRYARDVYRYALTLSRDRAEADDITSETFARVWSDFDRVRMPTVKAYLFAIARNQFLHLRRHSDRRASLDAEMADKADLETSVERRVEIEAVNLFLDTLPENDREIFLLRVRDEMSYEEIAGVFNISLSSAKVKVHRTRLKLIRFRAQRETP